MDCRKRHHLYLTTQPELSGNLMGTSLLSINFMTVVFIMLLRLVELRRRPSD